MLYLARMGLKRGTLPAFGYDFGGSGNRRRSSSTCKQAANLFYNWGRDERERCATSTPIKRRSILGLPNMRLADRAHLVRACVDATEHVGVALDFYFFIDIHQIVNRSG
jgi:hypothetical protein